MKLPDLTLLNPVIKFKPVMLKRIFNLL